MRSSPKHPQPSSTIPIPRDSPGSCTWWVLKVGGGGWPQLGTYLLKGGQQHVAVPTVLCKTQRDMQGSGDMQGDGQSHGGSEEKQKALPSWHHDASKLGKLIPARNTLLTLSFIHHRLHHHGINLAVQVEAQLERNRGGLVRWSSAEASPHLHLHGMMSGAGGTHLLLAPLRGVDGVGGHTELLAHPPLVVHRLRLQAVVPGGVAVPWGERTESGHHGCPHTLPAPPRSQRCQENGRGVCVCVSLLSSQMPLEVRSSKKG